MSNNWGIYQSEEEQHFAWWLEDCQAQGWIDNFVYHPCKFDLSPPVAIDVIRREVSKARQQIRDVRKPRHLFDECTYEPDFMIRALPELYRFDLKWFGQHPFEFYIDTKGEASKYDDGRSFVIKQKWVWSKHGVYINKVVPKAIFKRTFVPEKARYTPVKRDLCKPYLQFPLIAAAKLLPVLYAPDRLDIGDDFNLV